ncbi:unnamed protein product [Anisakis simplex]|uniref:Uncharacterized protein n=1 Tax=Anisakis simplex TaxID=6269 RepID=A0A0M3KHY0_ANISI|nr:unnamed protein product [Anisakis simplex]
MAKRRIIKKVTTTTTKSTIVIGGRRAPIAHKAYKGNASNQNRTNRNTMISNCARMVRHSTRIPKKITRFTESIPGRDIPKKSIKTRKILEQHQRKQPQNKKQHKLAIPKKDIVIAKKTKTPQSPSSRASLKRPPSDVDHSLRTEGCNGSIGPVRSHLRRWFSEELL